LQKAAKGFAEIGKNEARHETFNSKQIHLDSGA
jgi:hypothetical protein